MKIRESIVLMAFGAVLALEGWQLSMLVSLNAKVESLSARLEMHMRENPGNRTVARN